MFGCSHLQLLRTLVIILDDRQLQIKDREKQTRNCSHYMTGEWAWARMVCVEKGLVFSTHERQLFTIYRETTCLKIV